MNRETTKKFSLSPFSPQLLQPACEGPSLNDQTSNPKVGCPPKMMQKIRNAFCHGTTWGDSLRRNWNFFSRIILGTGLWTGKKTLRSSSNCRLHSQPNVCKISSTKLNRTNREPNYHCIGTNLEHGERRRCGCGATRNRRVTDGGGEQKKNERTRTDPCVDTK